MSTHSKSFGKQSPLGKKYSLAGKSSHSRKEDRGLPAKVIKGECVVPVPEPSLSEEQEKKLKAEAEAEHRANQRELVASQKRRDGAERDAKRALEKNPKHRRRSRSHRRRRPPCSKESSRRTGYLDIEPSSPSSSEESSHKRPRRSVISPLLWKPIEKGREPRILRGKNERREKRRGEKQQKKREGKKRRQSSGYRKGQQEVSKKGKKAAPKIKRKRSISAASSSDSEDSDEMKADKLARQMVGSLGKRSKFAHFDRKHFSSAAKLFAQAGSPSRTAISKLGDETRRFIREDLRKIYK